MEERKTHDNIIEEQAIPLIKAIKESVVILS